MQNQICSTTLQRSAKEFEPQYAQEEDLELVENGLPIIAICHLNWDGVWERPQQFLSRLSESHQVLFVETHRSETERSFTTTRSVLEYPQVIVLEVHLPSNRWEESNFIDLERRRVLQGALSKEFKNRYSNGILWFNDPMAATAYSGHLGERIIVYDCMDELSQFHGAPQELIQRERELVLQADIIFCGSVKMRNKRLPLNSNTHFYGTGVDCEHFGRCLSEELLTDPEIEAMVGPVLGYFGVIDERLDYDLITALAEAFPDGNIAMVGPTAKIDSASLPRRTNLHWLGARPYSQLPAITKGFSVCLMPFALNAATEYINPTKTLEYMAAGRPVVSTALDEVKSRFRSILSVGHNHEEYIDNCRKSVHSPSAAQIKKGIQLAAQNTWENIIEGMHADIYRTLKQKKADDSVLYQKGTISASGVGFPYQEL